MPINKPKSGGEELFRTPPWCLYHTGDAIDGLAALVVQTMYASISGNRSKNLGPPFTLLYSTNSLFSLSLIASEHP